MINIRVKKCLCNKVVPSFGFKNDKIPTCCAKCKKPEMIDIVSPKCLCGKVRPSFGLLNDKTPTCCSKCKTPEMVDIVSPKCLCGKSNPIYGLENDKKPTCCLKCKTPEMLNIKSAKCLCGKARPSFGLESDKQASCCVKCKTFDMIDIRSPKCKFEDCRTRADIKCYKGYCAYHFGNLFPDSPIVKNHKTKERKVVDYVRDNYPDFTWKFDRIIEKGCSRRRPDIFLDLDFQIIVIEIDEFQHKQYDKSCDNSRLMELSKDVNHRPIVFIRFNPPKAPYGALAKRALFNKLFFF